MDLSNERDAMFLPENKIYHDVMGPNTELVDRFKDVIISFAEMASNSFDDGLIVVADFCTADGTASLGIIQKIIEIIKVKNKDTEILVVYEDKEGTDYNVLFKQVLTDKILSYNGVFVMASATTMYKQCLPSYLAQFIFSFSGQYYLSRRPCLVKNSISPMFGSPSEKDMYSRQAASDWKLFLKNRSKELIQGGFLFLIPSVLGPLDVLQQLDVSLRSLLNDNIISEREFQDISFINYLRTEQEIKEPFQEEADEVKYLKFVSFEVVTHTFFTAPLKKEDASKVMEYVRTFTYNPIFNGLRGDRTMKEKTAIMNEFFQQFTMNFQQSKCDFYMTVPRLVIQKISE